MYALGQHVPAFSWCPLADEHHDWAGAAPFCVEVPVRVRYAQHHEDSSPVFRTTCELGSAKADDPS